MNEAVTLAMRPAPAGQATDRPTPVPDGVRSVMPGEAMVVFGPNGAIHEVFTELKLAADR